MVVDVFYGYLRGMWKTAVLFSLFLLLPACSEDGFSWPEPDPTQTPLPTLIPPPTITRQMTDLSPEWLSFPDGSPTQSVSHFINGGETKTFFFSGEVGQTLTLLVTSSLPGLTLSLYGEDNISLGSVRENVTLTAVLTTPQTYTVSITAPPTEASNISYTLTAMRSDPGIGGMEPLQLSAENPTVTVNGVLPANSDKEFSFTGQQAQTLSIELGPIDSNFTLTLHSADNEVIGWTVPGMYFSIPLPANGVYFLSLSTPNNGVSTEYVMTVTLQ